MIRGAHRRILILSLTICGLVLLALSPALGQENSRGKTNVTVVVKEADTGEPISQARLTLQFSEERKMRRDRHLSFSAKTNAQGRYKFIDIPKGTVRLMVTVEHHQSYGKDIEIAEDNPVIEVKMKKPQPLL